MRKIILSIHNDYIREVSLCIWDNGMSLLLIGLIIFMSIVMVNMAKTFREQQVQINSLRNEILEFKKKEKEKSGILLNSSYWL